MNVDDRATTRFLCAAAVLCLVLPSCAKKAGVDYAAASPEAGGDYAEMSDDDPLAQLDALEGRMAELGLPVAKGKGKNKSKEKRSRADDKSGERDFAEPPASADGAAAGMEMEADDASEELAEVEASPEMSPEPETAPMDASPGEAPHSQAQSKCEDLCSLNEAICDLEVKICGLSETHSGDPTYADACERAIDDCSTSGDACDACHG